MSKMSKRETSITADLENPLDQEDTGRGKSIFAGLLILSLIGLVVWFVVNNQEAG